MIRLIVGIIVGLFAITLVTEFIEFSTVLLLSGKSAEYLANNPQEYLEIRNQTGVLIFKAVYNLIAATIGGYLLTWIAKSQAKIGMYILVGVQTLSLVWAGFFSELSSTGPVWMWIALIILTPLGIYLGYRIKIIGSR